MASNQDLWGDIGGRCSDPTCDLANDREARSRSRALGLDAAGRDQLHAARHTRQAVQRGELRFEIPSGETRTPKGAPKMAKLRGRTRADVVAEVLRDNPRIREKRADQSAYQLARRIKSRRQADVTRADAAELEVDEARDMALGMLDDKTTTDALRGNTRQLDNLERIIRDDTDVARRMIVTESPDYRRAFTRYLREGPHGLFSPEESTAIRRWKSYERAQSEGTTTAGGFAIPVFIDPSVIVTDAGAPNPFLTLCTVRDITTRTWRGVVSAAPVWSVDGENTEASDRSMTSMSQPSIPTYQIRSWIPYSIEIGEDYPEFQSEMTAALAQGYDEILLDKFTRGVGSTEPTGLLTALAAAVPTVLVTSSTDGAFSDTDIQNTWSALPAKYRAHATWMASTTVTAEIRQTSTVYHASAVTLEGPASEIVNGRQLIEAPYFPAASSTTGANTRLCVGDFSQMSVIRRRGMTVEVVPLVFGSSQRPTGQRGLYASARIGSDVPNPNAFRFQANV